MLTLGLLPGAFPGYFLNGMAQGGVQEFRMFSREHLVSVENWRKKPHKFKAHKQPYTLLERFYVKSGAA